MAETEIPREGSTNLAERWSASCKKNFQRVRSVADTCWLARKNSNILERNTYSAEASIPSNKNQSPLYDGSMLTQKQEIWRFFRANNGNRITLSKAKQNSWDAILMHSKSSHDWWENRMKSRKSPCWSTLKNKPLNHETAWSYNEGRLMAWTPPPLVLSKDMNVLWDSTLSLIELTIVSQDVSPSLTATKSAPTSWIKACTVSNES